MSATTLRPVQVDILTGRIFPAAVRGLPLILPAGTNLDGAPIDTGSVATWGTVIGTLSNQTDLSNALAAKQSLTGTLALGGFGSITGTLPGANSSQKVFNVKDAAYGAVGNGVTNDKTAIQSAINAAAAAGGGTVYFPLGVYLVTGTLDGTTNSLLKIPQVNEGSEPVPIKFQGEIVGRLTDASATTKGVVIKSTTVGSGTYPSILAAHAYADTTGDLSLFNYVSVEISDILFRTTTNPTLTAINLHNAATASVNRVKIDAGQGLAAVTVQPSNSQAVGLILPGINNNFEVSAKDVSIIGYYEGIRASEHTSFERVGIARCRIGLVSENGYRPFRGHVACQQCPTMVSFVVGTSSVDLDLEAEIQPVTVDNFWYQTTGADILDASNYGYGRITYKRTDSSVGNVTTNVGISGGANLETYNIYTHALTQGSNMSRSLVGPDVAFKGQLSLVTTGTVAQLSLYMGTTHLSSLYYDSVGDDFYFDTSFRNGDVKFATGSGKVNIDSLTASSLVQTDSSKNLASLALPLGAAYGGTGVANNAAATLTRSGNFAQTVTLTGVTNNTYPTSGTLATLDGTETFTNKSIAASQLTGTIAPARLSLTIAELKTALSDETTVVGNLLSLANPSAISFIKIAADNTVSTRTPAQVLGDIGAQATLGATITGTGTIATTSGKTLTFSQDTTLNRQSSTGLPVEFCIAMSDEATAITTGTAKVTWRAPYAFTVTSVRASLNTVSSSGTPTFDINEAGTTILSTKLTIDASELTSVTAAVPAVISDSAIADDAEITMDVDVAGTGAKGAKIWILGYR